MAAIRGQKALPLGVSGGSLNYQMMDAGTAVLVAPEDAGARTRWLSLLADQQKWGHLSRRGPNGVQNEAGAPSMHWTFNVAPVLGVLIMAGKRLHEGKAPDWARDLWDTGFTFLKAEIGLDRAFRWKGRSIIPCPRAKDEKQEGPIDGYRDVVTALALGEKVNKPTHYWTDDQAIAASSMRQLLPLLGPAYKHDLAMAPMPSLMFPIHSKSLDGGGFIAWIEDTPEARTAFGHDALNWVRCTPANVDWGYDWSEVPAA